MRAGFSTPLHMDRYRTRKYASSYDASKWRLTSELLFNGTNGGTIFTDTTGRTWSASGNAQTSTAQFYEGTASLVCDGTGDYITTVTSEDLQPFGDWRMELAIRPTNFAKIMMVVTNQRVTGSGGFALQIGTGGLVTFAAASESVNIVVLTSPSAISAAAWAEVAIERIGNRWAMQIGGVEVVADNGNGQPYCAASSAFYIGRQASTVARDYLGYVDRFRVYRGNP